MIVLALMEYAILASTFTISKVAIRYADPLFLIGVRMLIAAPLMILVHRIQSRAPLRIAKKDILLFIAVGVFHILLPFMGEFWALQYVSSAKTAITYALTPFIAAVFSFFLLKRVITMKQSIGLTIGLLGLLPIFFSSDDVTHIAGELFHVSLPEIVLLGAVVSASYAWFLVSDLMQRGYGISLINGVAMFLGGAASLCIWFLTDVDRHPITGSFFDFALWTALLIIVANVIAYNFYGWLLKHLSINFMSAIGFTCPIFASIYGVVFLQEDLGISHAVALLLVCGGLWLFYQDEIRKTRQEKRF